MIGVILLILSAAGVAKFLSGGDSDESTDLESSYTPQLNDEPRLGTRNSSGTYSRGYRFDKETGLFEEE